MRLAFPSVVLAALSFTVPLSAQAPPVVESIEVRIVNVDAAVRDKAGNPVTGLTREDFELYEDGKRQEITNFYEVRGGAPAGTEEARELRTRRLAIFIDQLSIDPLERNKVLRALQTFLQTQLKPEDEVMVASWNGRLNVRQEFTTDQKLIAKTLEEVTRESGHARTWARERKQIQDVYRQEIEMALEPNSKFKAIPQIWEAARADTRVYADSLRKAMKQMAGDLARLTAMFGATEGKKAILFVGQSVPHVPGLELYDFMDDLFRPVAMQYRLNSMKTEALSHSEALTQEEIVRAANAAGVTYYMIHAGDTTGMDESKVEQQTETVNTTSQFISAQNNISSFRIISQQTGGVAIAGRRDYARAFAQISADLNNYYSLGYKPSAPERATQRRLEVKVKNRDLVVRARNSFLPKSLAVDLQEQTVANVLQPRPEKDVTVEISSGAPTEHEPGISKVPVQIRIHLDDLTLLPQESDLAGGFDIYFTVGHGDGNTSPVSKQSKPLKFPIAQKDALKGHIMVFNVEILMRSGKNVLSVGVADVVGGNVGFARHEVMVK